MMNRKWAMLVAVALVAVMVSVVPAVASCYYSTVASVNGYLGWSGDEDSWSVELTKNVRYNFKLTVAYNDDFDIYVYYWLYGEKVYVAMGIEGTGVDESVYFTAPRNTTYHIEVDSWRGSGSYTLTLRKRYC